MSYRVTVTSTRVVPSKEWVCVTEEGQRRTMGYVPSEQEISEQIYCQEVDEINLKAIIAAVNP